MFREAGKAVLPREVLQAVGWECWLKHLREEGGLSRTDEGAVLWYVLSHILAGTERHAVLMLVVPAPT